MRITISTYKHSNDILKLNVFDNEIKKALFEGFIRISEISAILRLYFDLIEDTVMEEL